jgi:NAD(P)-dependent dehydrogenase (short-subunit alcohol dehydrogenase family)
MIARGHGRIVMHSSVVGYTPLRWRAAYVATKHAIEGLTNTMRVELRGTGVHVSILNTGPVASGFRENSTKLFDRWIDVDASRHATYYRTSSWPASQRCAGCRSKELPRTSSGNSSTPWKRRARARGTSLHPMPMSPPSLTRILPDRLQGPDRREIIAFCKLPLDRGGRGRKTHD